MGKFIVIVDTNDLTNTWLTHIGIYDLVDADLIPQYKYGIRRFERKHGVPEKKYYHLSRTNNWIHVDFSEISIAQ